MLILTNSLLQSSQKQSVLFFRAKKNTECTCEPENRPNITSAFMPKLQTIEKQSAFAHIPFTCKHIIMT